MDLKSTVIALGGALLNGMAIHDYIQEGRIGLAGIIMVGVGTLLFTWGALLMLGKEKIARKIGWR